MAKPPSTRSANRKTVARGKRKDSGAPAKSPEERSFIESLIAHGQAVRVPPGKQLPAGATHEIVDDADGEVRVVRRRFSAI